MSYLNQFMETVAFTSLKDVSPAVVWEETVPTGGIERSFVNAEVINGVTPATTTAAVFTVTYTPSGGSAVTVGTITWSATQAAYTGVALNPNKSYRLAAGDKLSIALTTAPAASTTAILKIAYR